jgi:hypothetical protein
MAQYSPLTNQLAKESLEESQNLIQKFEKNAG